ncbi:MAG: glycogen/starch synthase [bacterium]
MRILHVTSEVAPYSKSGGLGDVLADLPVAQRRRGHDAVVLSPLYGQVPREGLVRRLEPTTVRVGWRTFEGHLWAREGLLFFEAPDLFDRAGMYGHADDPLRFAALCKLAAALAHDFDVVHLHDWQAGLTALYLAGARPVVHTIHNLAYQGICHPGWADDLEIPHELRRFTGLEFHGNLSLLKAGLVLSSRVTTVSPTYAREIVEEPGGAGMAGVLSHRPDGVAGLLNGIDPGRFDPAADPALAAAFSAGDLAGRARCRAALQAELGLEDGPVFAVVGRAVHQKGLDLVAAAVPGIVAAGAAWRCWPTAIATSSQRCVPWWSRGGWPWCRRSTRPCRGATTPGPTSS